MIGELKPCPFCGGTDLHLESFSGWGADVIVCYNCLATFSQQEITCEEDLIEAWNRRAELQWIPCSERLPEDEYVIISKKPTKLSGSKWCVDVAIRIADPRSGKIQWRDSGFGVIQDDKVLAWMPRPKPYKEEE